MDVPKSGGEVELGGKRRGEAGEMKITGVAKLYACGEWIREEKIYRLDPETFLLVPSGS